MRKHLHFVRSLPLIIFVCSSSNRRKLPSIQYSVFLICLFVFVFICLFVLLNFVALVSVSLLYYFGLPSNHRSLNLLQWFMQLISIYVIYSSCYSKQFAVTVVTLLILFQFLSFKDLLKRIIYFV